jgi:hypothetical protein
MHEKFEAFLRRHEAKVELIAKLAGLVALVHIEVVKKAGRR